MTTLNTSQPGHWYKCKNPKCDLMLPLPDYLFVESKSDAFAADCECGHKNSFTFPEGGNETKKWEVDNFFGVKDPRNKFIAFWEEA